MGIDTGSQLIFENAKRLFAAAELLATSKEFPIANSLMILAAEESVKAIFVEIQKVLPEKKIEGYEKLFKEHKHKLEKIETILQLKTFVNRDLERAYRIITETENKSTEECEAIRKKINADFFEGLEKDFLSKSSLTSDLGWWKQAQYIKESGFYVDNIRDKWILPTQIKKSHYTKSKKRVSVIMETAELAISSNLAENQDFLDFKGEFKEKLTTHFQSL